MTSTTIALEHNQKEEAIGKPVGQWQLVWRRLRRHHLAMAGGVVIILFTILSFLSPWIAPYPYEEQNLGQLYNAWFSPGEAGYPTHIMGTDGLGRDTFSRILYAGRISLGVALAVTLINIIIGTLVGAISGSFGGVMDSALMRFTDVMLTLPDLPLLLILSTSLRSFAALQQMVGAALNVLIIVFVLAFFGWMGNARLVRGSVLSLRTQEFVEASRALGATNFQIIFKHLIPNSLAPILVAATLGFGGVIIAESALSFLGFGINPPVPTWGNMLNEARMAPQVGSLLFTQTVAPGLCIFLTVLSINFLGDGLRDALDPRLKL